MIVEGMRLHHGPRTPTALDKKLSYERGIGSGWTSLKEGVSEGGPRSELLRKTCCPNGASRNSADWSWNLPARLRCAKVCEAGFRSWRFLPLMIPRFESNAGEQLGIQFRKSELTLPAQFAEQKSEQEYFSR